MSSATGDPLDRWYSHHVSGRNLPERSSVNLAMDRVSGNAPLHQTSDSNPRSLSRSRKCSMCVPIASRPPNDGTTWSILCGLIWWPHLGGLIWVASSGWPHLVGLIPVSPTGRLATRCCPTLSCCATGRLARGSARRLRACPSRSPGGSLLVMRLRRDHAERVRP